MTIKNRDRKKSSDGIFRVFESITEVVGWLQIVVSPILIGIVLGAVIYFLNPSMTSLVLGIIVAALGLVIGIMWATKQWKGKGTIWFISRIIATPELDKLDEDKGKKMTKKDAEKIGNR